MKINLPDTKFQIGQKFLYYAEKTKRVWQIDDIIYTINSSGKILFKEYKCYCIVLNQKVYNNFPESSITRSQLVQ